MTRGGVAVGGQSLVWLTQFARSKWTYMQAGGVSKMRGNMSDRRVIPMPIPISRQAVSI